MSDPVAEDAQADLVSTRWWLVRHGPVINPENIIYGKLDMPIDTSDSGLYAPLAAALPRGSGTRYLTSTRGRTHATLQRVAQAGGRDCPVFDQVSGFDEQDFGDWETQSWDSLFENGRSHTFWLAPAASRPPGGESFTDVMKRVAKSLRDLSHKHAGKDLILFAHGGTIRAALAHALGLDGETALRFSIDNCSLTRLSHLQLADGSQTWHVGHVNLAPTRPTGFCPS